MRPKILLSLTLPLLLIAGSATAETVAGLPLHIQKFDSGAIRVWIGDHISSTATVAIPTEKGLVIIDTTGNPKVDRELRAVIARELGRDDFAMLINTHEHGDHTGGNAVYADCTIVGHELVAEGIRRSGGDRQRIIDWLTTNLADLEKQIAELAADDPQVARLQEDLILDRLQIAVLQENAPLVPPTKTFADRLELDMGDATFELSYIGGMHSASDIAILVPEHGLLMTGDTMADVWLTDTPGCLASFAARPGVRHDFPRLLANWNALLARKDEIRTLLPGHWNGELSFAGFEERVRYIEAMWEGIGREAAAGTPLDDLLAEYRLDSRFPTLVDSPGCNQRNTSTTLVEMWGEVTDQQSAAIAMYDILEAGGDEAAVRKILAQFDADPPVYYFLEAHINGRGYRFLQQDKTEQAVILFRANVELFPESWNVYDSLGEALMAAGNDEEAIVMYERSLELNPENDNGRRMLEQMANEASVN